MAERMTLYHGTSFEIVGGKVANGKEPLIGKRLLSEPDLSGTLTDEKEFAVNWAHKRGGDPIVLTYSIPVNLLIDEGIIAMKSFAHAYVTTITIAREHLPPAYLRAIMQLNPIHPDVLDFLIEQKKLTFHRVPHTYFVMMEDV